VRVSYADLDMSKAEDAEALLHRIHSAARTVCDGRAGRRPLEQMRQTRGCMVSTEERTVAELGLPQLTAAYRERNGTAPTLLSQR